LMVLTEKTFRDIKQNVDKLLAGIKRKMVAKTAN